LEETQSDGSSLHADTEVETQPATEEETQETQVDEDDTSAKGKSTYFSHQPNLTDFAVYIMKTVFSQSARVDQSAQSHRKVREKLRNWIK
jgi:hypothetical protein